MPDNTPIIRTHRILLGKKATQKQCQFYKNFPTFRGMSDQSLDPEILEAVLMASLTFGTAKDRVYFFAPLAHEKWVLEQINGVINIVFDRCRTWTNGGGIAKRFGVLFKKLVIMGRLLQIEKEPQRWVSFGFSKEDPVPEWVVPRLL